MTATVDEAGDAAYSGVSRSLERRPRACGNRQTFWETGIFRGIGETRVAGRRPRAFSAMRSASHYQQTLRLKDGGDS